MICVNSGGATEEGYFDAPQGLGRKATRFLLAYRPIHSLDHRSMPVSMVLWPAAWSSPDKATYNRLFEWHLGMATWHPSLWLSTSEGEKRHDEGLILPCIQLYDSRKGTMSDCTTRPGPEVSHQNYSHPVKALTKWSPGSTVWSMGSSQTTAKIMAIHMDRLGLYLEATQGEQYHGR
jgi:hypothetical protein